MGVGHIHYQDHHYVKALEHYQKAQKQNPKSEKALEYTSWVHYRLGNTKEGKKTIHSLLQLGSFNTNIQLL